VESYPPNKILYLAVEFAYGHICSVFVGAVVPIPTLPVSTNVTLGVNTLATLVQKWNFHHVLSPHAIEPEFGELPPPPNTGRTGDEGREPYPPAISVAPNTDRVLVGVVVPIPIFHHINVAEFPVPDCVTASHVVVVFVVIVRFPVIVSHDFNTFVGSVPIHASLILSIPSIESNLIAIKVEVREYR
jgi:hypothetical protein